MVIGEFPFHGNTYSEMRKDIENTDLSKVFQEQRWNGISDEIKDFLLKGLQRRPELRPSVDELLGHQWLKGCLKPPKMVYACQTVAQAIFLIRSGFEVSEGNMNEVIQALKRVGGKYFDIVLS